MRSFGDQLRRVNCKARFSHPLPLNNAENCSLATSSLFRCSHYDISDFPPSFQSSFSQSIKNIRHVHIRLAVTLRSATMGCEALIGPTFPTESWTVSRTVKLPRTKALRPTLLYLTFSKATLVIQDIRHVTKTEAL